MNHFSDGGNPYQSPEVIRAELAEPKPRRIISRSRRFWWFCFVSSVTILGAGVYVFTQSRPESMPFFALGLPGLVFSAVFLLDL